ncbi:MAG: GatB/YqeY domain-containing protein [Gemmataceae bacterium]
MSMLEMLKQKLLACRKAGQSVEMGVLQVVLGEASMIEARSGKKASDEEIEKTIRKVMLGNQETLGVLTQKGMTASDNFAKLTQENVLLASLLPQTLSVAEIAQALAEVSDALRAAKNDGQATGVAMKHLKSKNLRVLGDDVAAAVKQLRA